MGRGDIQTRLPAPSYRGPIPPLAGPVATDANHPEHTGATHATNNAGELIAMTKMIQAASALAAPAHPACAASARGEPSHASQRSAIVQSAAIGTLGMRTTRRFVSVA